ncbi:hypothetical protein C7293_23580 [filamentous cyanobacterium CCT1]|uniref:hypothetical protein n=1 Tax=Nodosilinea sp. AN01ver1 TaxID=3423362 RepID=UPI000D12E7C5|nr:hypothetical protein C7293_23580 [filamentous cyanobacterium CCT1]PSN75690.1 hypothetical protein C8B47_31250 [filamentous cyanobacterium CCP4]
MTVQKTLTYTVVAFGLALTLGACGSSEEQSSAPADTEAVAEAPAAEAQTAPDPSAEMQSSQGGQVVESGPYHLELITANEPTGVHLDFFLQKGDTHEAIADAKVMAQIQAPDGTQESIELSYDADGAHYTAMVPVTAAGDYNVAILSDIGGEKVNGRFTFAK